METNCRRWAGLLIGLLSMVMIVIFGGALTAQAANKTLMVNGENILTATDHTVQCGSGTAVYDESSSTLTLTNATISTTDDECIYSSGIDLKIQVNGTNTLSANLSAPDGFNNTSCIYYEKGSLSIVGTGTLDVTAQASESIVAVILGAGNGLTIEGPTVNITAPEKANAGIDAFGKDFWEGEPVNINSANVTVSTAGGCAILTSTDLTIKNSKVNATTNNQVGSLAIGIAFGGDIIIEDSEVYALGESAIAAGDDDNTITIKGNSDVIADGNFSSDRLIIIPADGERIEYIAGTSESTAQPVKDSPYDSATTYEPRYDFWSQHSYTRIRQQRPDPVEPSQPSQGDHRPCHHRYEWDITKKATATDDGVMKYRCKYCGKVEYEVPISAYYVFNKDTQEAILKAEQGATVKVQTPLFISFHEMVKNALQERPDVALVVDYKNAGSLYEMTIPAGSGDQLEALFGESKFAGFLYLGGAYATTELPADTQFTNIPAELMWFGTTNAH